MMATSGIENVVRLWEPRNQNGTEDDRGGKPESESDARVVSDLARVSRENQHRMGVDPFEVMLMRMGFRLAEDLQGRWGGEGPRGGGGGGGGVGGEAVRGEDPGEPGEGEGEEEEGGERMEEGEVRWIENPSNCRQS